MLFNKNRNKKSNKILAQLGYKRERVKRIVHTNLGYTTTKYLDWKKYFRNYSLESNKSQSRSILIF